MGFRRREFFRALLLALLAGAILGAWPAEALAARAGGASWPAGTTVPGTALQALSVAQLAQLAPADGAAYDYFGYAVALSGDTALVGARGAKVGGDADRGAAYFFTRSGAAWTLQAKVAASDGAAGDRFGYSVALSGDTAVIGADVGGDADQGAVYVFTRSGVVWVEQARLSVTTADPYPRFGCSVALSGTTLIAGASWSDVSGASDQGAAYVFTGGGATWTQQAQLTAATGAAGDSFGTSVAIAGDTALIGADVGGAADRGAAHVFTRSGATWTERATLAASDGAPLDQFGFSVGLSGDTAVVGAQGADVAGVEHQGAVYVFTGGGSSWTQQAKLTVASSYLGSSVAISGEAVVAGAVWDDGGGADRGAAYVFTRNGASWTRQSQLAAADGRSNDRFGYSVAVFGDTALAGAPAEWLEGRAYVFTGLQPEPPAPSAKPATPRGRSPKGVIGSRTPTIKWAAAARAAKYQVRVLKGARVIAKKPAVATTSWRCGTRLPRRVWLTWQVRATNAAGWSAWSAKLRFKVR